MDELTPDQLEAILGTDYETILADILRRKGSAEDRRHQQNEIGQVGNGHVFFDPAGAINNVLQRRRAGKESAAAQAEMDKVLEQQKQGRRTYAEALLRKPPAPMSAPRSVDSTLPVQPTPAPTGPLANAQTLPPDRLAAAGVPPDVMAMLARLRGQ